MGGRYFRWLDPGMEMLYISILLAILEMAVPRLLVHRLPGDLVELATAGRLDRGRVEG